MTRARGIDVSHWDGFVNYPKAFANGASFVYAKASQWVIDPRFQENWRNAKDILLRGAYHFLDWGLNELRQADLFLKSMDGDWGELPPVLDLEMDPTPYGLNAATVRGRVWNFLTRVEAAIGRTPALYVGYYYWNTWGSTNAAWAHYPHWLPWYAPEWYIRLRTLGTGAPKPWPNWTFWQDTDRADGLAYGCQSLAVDTNWFNGTVEELRAYASSSPLPPPPLPVSTLYVVVPWRINVRLGASVKSPWVRYADRGEEMNIPHFETVVNGYVQMSDGNWVWSAYVVRK